MAFTLQNFYIYTTKFLFFNVFKTQCNQKILSVDYRTLSYKADFVKIQRSFTNFRTLFFSTLWKEEVKKVTITFITHEGTKFKKTIPVGKDIVDCFPPENTDIPKFGACDGNQACATCHVKFPKYFIDKLEKPESFEEDIIVCANEYDEDHSRLACCVEVTEDMDGIVLLIPEIKDVRERD